MLTDDQCYRAMASRDRRFEGRFFVAVDSTGIYCRPGCPARIPRRQNVHFVPTAAAAEAEGFRPCKRCRPDASPGTDAWTLSSPIVARALRAIHQGALDEGRVEELAERCGVGARHLSRLFQDQLGASPIAIAQTRRVHFARRLIDQTRLPMTQVAFSSGFSSVRRFNTAVQQTFGHSPTELRNGRGREREPILEISLPYRPPFDWEAMWAFLAPRCLPGIESFGDGVFRRRVCTGDVHGITELRARPEHDQVELRVPSSMSPALQDIVERVQRLLDLRADPRVIAGAFGRDRLLRRGARRGTRVPGAFDGFEVAVRAVLGQQVTVRGATTLAGRLVQRFGRRIDPGEDLPFAFPTPETLAGAELDKLGMPRARGEAIRQLAAAVCESRLDLSPAADPEVTHATLCSLPGIGPWTATYISMRALGHPDAFPEGDLALRKAVADDGRPVPAAQLRTLAESWRPWRAYAATALWDHLRTRENPT